MSKKQNKQVENTPAVPEKEELDDDDDLDISEDEEGGTRIGGIYIPPPIKPYCSTESKGPRLIITKIVNTNFKSYAGTVEVGPFHNRFSAVMGPNGSGKSNVIDSMLFVFGCRAGKIRAKTFKSMIHKSSKYPNVRSCKVAVHFAQVIDKEDGSHVIVPNTEFVIARTATIDSKSHYTIDGREVNFKAVAALLSGFGVDLKYNRFLILQGEVEQISLMKPKAMNENENGLLEYLEDIIGTSRYKRPLQLLSERLEKFNEERTDKHNRCRLAERDMKELEEPKNVAVEYLKLENKLVYNQNIYYQKQVLEKKKSIEKITEDKNKIVEELEEHDTKFEVLKKERLEKEALINEEIKKHESLCTKKEEFKSMLHKAKGAREGTNAMLQSTNNRRKDLMKQVKNDEKKLEEYKSLPEKNQKEIDESQNQIEKLNKQKTDLENELTENLSKIEDDTKPLREEIDPLENKLATLKSSLDECKATYNVTEKELAVIKSEEINEMRKYESLKYSYEESLTNLKENQSQLSECEKVIPEVKKTIAENTKKIQQLSEEEVKKSAELEQLKLKIDENMQTMQSNHSNNRVLNALMQQRQNGKIPGILGRLGDLGGIDAKYDVAISTCCGRLDNIVVDTVDTAQKCIEFLKAHNVGRATFISLEKVEYLMDVLQQRIQTPENVHRLFDLIRVEDERVLAAFYFSLHDTLVANDLEQGTRIAYGKDRYRVVTLSGDVIEISGTMSGGGNTQMRGKMGQKVQTKTANMNSSFSEKDIENLQVKAEQMRYHIYDLQYKRQDLEKETKALQKHLQIKEQEYNNLVCKVKSLTVQLPRVEESVKKQQEKAENTKSDPAKVKELEERLKNAKSDYDKKQGDVDVIQKKVDELTARIKEITDTKVKSVRVKIEKVSKQIEKLTTNISKLSVEIRTTERNVQKTTEKINSAKVEIEEAENSIRRMVEERNQFDKDIGELETKFEEITKEIEAATKDSSSIKKEIAAIHKQENDGKMARLEIEEKIKAVDKKLQDENKTIPVWENKRKQLKLHEIPMETITPLKVYTEEQLEGRKLEDINYEITQLEAQVENKPNLGIIEEYNQKRILYLERVKILEEITMKRNEIREGFDAVKKKRYMEFNEGFAIISRKLKEMYQMITLGGDAELELVDTMDPFSEGIVFSVRPPKKSWKVITNLSGGEKTLSSLALVFALHYYKPSPLYFMDEIDAALDFKNVSIVANYINERTKNAQFIIISLRSNMFELADRLVGIFKTFDCTQSVTIDNTDKKREIRIESINNNMNQLRSENSENIQISQSDISGKEPMDIDLPVQSDPFDAVKNSSQIEV